MEIHQYVQLIGSSDLFCHFFFFPFFDLKE
jgi:hypothetical protein